MAAADVAGNRINRYIMECKSVNTIADNKTASELIDTLWNVNTMIEQMRRLATYPN